VVVLPTGSGKSHMAIMAIADRARATLVVAPTLDLVRQWYDLLRTAFGCEVGVVGGGEHRVLPLTVTTYDSAWLHMEHMGDRFGLVIFDECHHLPSASYAMAAKFCLAPYRLGLTATPERSDGRDDLLDELIGPQLYQQDIVEMSGRWLADYDVERLVIELTAEEREQYTNARALYRDFVRSNGIRMSAPDGWAQFVMRSAVSVAGRQAWEAWRLQKRLATCASGKLEALAHLLRLHCADRMIIFTADNATAYEISRRFLVPAITHQTKVSERSTVLARLRSGEYGAVVTSKVLNEGVDVPEANVAVIISGSGSVREHVQRLGRILRKQADKRAILYELVAGDTVEAYTSQRRREHIAYR
jgi:superfamily II DNA or RNA helicase